MSISETKKQVNNALDNGAKSNEDIEETIPGARDVFSISDAERKRLGIRGDEEVYWARDPERWRPVEGVDRIRQLKALHPDLRVVKDPENHEPVMFGSDCVLVTYPHADKERFEKHQELARRDFEASNPETRGDLTDEELDEAFRREQDDIGDELIRHARQRRENQGDLDDRAKIKRIYEQRKQEAASRHSETRGVALVDLGAKYHDPKYIEERERRARMDGMPNPNQATWQDQIERMAHNAGMGGIFKSMGNNAFPNPLQRRAQEKGLDPRTGRPAGGR